MRSPIVLTNKGLPACAGHNPIFPKPTEAQPQSAERAALIAQIVDASVIAKMKPDAEDSPSVQKTLLDKSIAQRKQRLDFSLPDAYWAEYQQNLEQFDNEIRGTKARSLQLYKDDYRTQQALLKETLSTHQARMADLDQRFEVCKRFAACWQR
ncbi:hypothetical protein [Pseudomonas sp. MWU349]|uniref:hypothetical protein n=1 Tax=Pseudomonas sp. MWU349 TaxID=2802572 RepID=UPI001B32246B